MEKNEKNEKRKKEEENKNQKKLKTNESIEIPLSKKSLENEKINDNNNTEENINNQNNNNNEDITNIKYVTENQLDQIKQIEKEQGLKIKEFSNNEEMLRKRTDDLIEIKSISAQVAEMSTKMGIEINEQGKKLDSIENNIDETEENTKKAYKEALETEIIMNKSKKKLYCMAFFLYY